MAGKLWLVATPIGNLGDISARALEVLRAADLIAAEDTRNTVRLLNHFEIKKPLTSYHEYNKTEKAYELVREAQAGKNIAVVTDAGMPAISSGLPTRRFAFEAFLPADKGERAEVLQELQRETRTIVLYEAPHRLLKTLKELRDCLGEERRISLVRELTKIHEEVRRSTLGEAVALYEAPGGAELIRGEYVLVIEGRDPEENRREEAARWESMTVADHVAMYEKQGMDRKEAMRNAAKDRGVSRRDIYQALL